MKRAVTSLPLHYGKAPAWLFGRMKKLAAAVMEAVVLEFGPREFLDRMADPVWFQAFGCAAGFDWHSSGLTTTLCGALKEGALSLGDDFPVAICGGKAKRAIRTPQELEEYGERWSMDANPLIEMSRLCAKIDNTAVQDGYNLYHHTFIFTRKGDWAIVQQGMNGAEHNARRYQWLSKDSLDVTCEPHTGITCDERTEVLNLVARQSEGTREATVSFAKEDPDRMMGIWKEIALSMPERHYIKACDVNQTRLSKIFKVIHESRPETFRDLIRVKGVGPRTVGAMALVSELVYTKPPSFQDPARFSFAHGGKDGHPFPVDRKSYDQSIEFLKTCLDKARLGDREKLDAFRKLARL
jgi:hypothetical protein